MERKLSSRLGSYSRSFLKGHAHRFRDTFAVDFSFVACRLNGYQCSLGIKACVLRKNIIHHGCGRGRSSLSRTSSALGSRIL